MSQHGEIRDAVRAVLDREATSERMRSVLDSTSGFDPGLWHTIAELGWAGLHIPEEYGGLGQSFADLAVVLQELGRRLTPTPFFSSAVLATTALLSGSNEEIKHAWLPGFAAGTCRGTLAMSGPSGALHDMGLRYESCGDDFSISGSAAFALDAHTADLLILFARDGAGGLAAFAVPISRAGIDITVTPGFDQTRRMCTVSVHALRVSRKDALVTPGDASRLIDHVIDIAALGLACDSVGGADRALQMIIGYAKERVQFGRLIGSFQAVKHKCADMLLLVEGMRVAVEHAAEQVELGKSNTRDTASIAKAYAGEAYVKVAGDSMQLHGGIGFTWEHDMHLFLKRAVLNQQLFGSSSWHRECLAKALFPEAA